MDLDHAACYRALLTRDARFDGRLFIGVRTTGIYCRPVCPVRTPSRENVQFYLSAAAAQEAGFRPCLRCRPETAPEFAAWRGTSNTVSRALALIECGALDEADVDTIAARLGVGARQLRRLFRQHLGASPIAVAQTRRVLLARQLIHETQLPMTEVAMASGFGSVRRFNETFQRLFGRAPGALRRAQGQEVAGGAVVVSLSYRPPYDWPAILSFLRLRAIPGVESVSAHSYARTIELHGVCGMVLVEQGNGHTLRASIPLYASSNTRLGVLNVASRCWRELSPEELRLLYTVGDLLSIAIERARLFEQSAQLGASEERNRLARELHDTLAQGLAAIALQLESAEALLEAGTDTRRLQRAITQALSLTRINLEEVRRSVLDLRAAPLEGRTLAAALADLLEQVAAAHGFDVHLTTIGGARPLPPRLEVGLYRMAQEALTNVAQHAAARRVIISLVSTPTLVQLVIEDDGQGFDSAAIPPHHYGLIGLNERARLLGGSLRIESSRGVGTRLEVQLPLSAAGPQPHVATTAQRQETQ